MLDKSKCIYTEVLYLLLRYKIHLQLEFFKDKNHYTNKSTLQSFKETVYLCKKIYTQDSSYLNP